MILLGLGVLVFALGNFTLVVPQADAALRHGLGRLYGRPAFGLVSLCALGLIVLGWRVSPSVSLYEPPSWGWIATFILLLPAFLCLGIFLFRGSLRQIVRFPLAWGVFFWSLGHLFANGDAASLVLFGGLLVFALAYVMLGVANGIRPSTIIRQGHDALSFLISVALYGAVAQLHPLYAGVPVVTL